MLLPMVARADAVEIDGIYYNLVEKIDQAEVIRNPNKYSGIIVIPETVEYEGRKFKVTSIAEDAFYSCESLTSITIGNNITKIGSFYACKKLNSITIGKNVNEIQMSAFFDCLNLKYVYIHDLAQWCNIKFVNNYSNPLHRAHRLFLNNEEIKDLVIPNTITSINQLAFYSCSSLKSVTIPSSITQIGYDAFEGCTGIESVYITDLVAWCNIYFNDDKSNPLYYANHFYISENEVNDLVIPNNIESIKINSFSHSKSISTVIIPNSVISIEKNAFKECTNLRCVTLGNNVKNIDEGAFQTCKNLEEVFCYSDQPPLCKTHFYGDLLTVNPFKESYIEYATLHVPAESVNAYKGTEPWKLFGTIVAIEGGDTPEPPEPQKCEKPIINYVNGQLKMSCATEGVEYVTDITDVDVKKHYDSTISLTATYNISVYATKSGYENSETANATLCWIDQKPTTEGITDGIVNVPARALLIKNNGGQLTVEGAADGEAISVYTVNAVQSGSAISQNGAASIDTNLKAGSIAIVKIGDKSVKVVIK